MYIIIRKYGEYGEPPHTHQSQNWQGHTHIDYRSDNTPAEPTNHPHTVRMKHQPSPPIYRMVDAHITVKYNFHKIWKIYHIYNEYIRWSECVCVCTSVRDYARWFIVGWPNENGLATWGWSQTLVHSEKCSRMCMCVCSKVCIRVCA